MKAKRILAGCLCLALTASAAGCGEIQSQSEGGNADTAASTGDPNAPAGADGENEPVTVSDAAAEVTGALEVAQTGDSNENVKERLAELYGDDTIEITIFSQLANYSGKLTGWFSQVLKNEFNCEATIIPDVNGTFDTRMESGNLGDMVIIGSMGEQYQRAAQQGMLFNWYEDDILSEWGPYVKANMPYALENNVNFNATLGLDNTLYGFGHNVATTTEDHDAFFYTMDVRWDLYKELGYPKINTIDDLNQLFVDMKQICPTDENGNETYAVSLWPDWDGNMVMYVKAFATCYYGYDEMGFGLYDVENGTYHDALEPDGPYLKSLKFFNKLYQEGLVDPNSMTQTYDQMSEKMKAGGAFFSIFDYAGSQLYNSDAHLSEDKGMYPLVPEDATPLCYGMNVRGSNRVWCIGANTEYPELCMAIINYLSTPEGYMTYWYGPKDLCWYYNEDGDCCFTALGEQAYKDRKGTIMPDEWGGGTFNDGTFQANNTTWSRDASNPDSNGETYNCDNWRSRRVPSDYGVQTDWRDYNGFYTPQEYMNSKNHKVSLATSYVESDKSDELKLIWEQVKNCIIQYSWKAIYSTSDEEFDQNVAEMTQKCGEYDPNGECLAWCENEAALRDSLEDPLR